MGEGDGRERGAEHTGTATTNVLAAPTLELVCHACGYGVVVRHAPSVCPMCGEREWAPPLWRPFSRRPQPPGEAA